MSCPLLAKCPDCEWQELLPPRRRLSQSLDNQAGAAFSARMARHEAIRMLFEQIRALAPPDFDRFCAQLFERLGYEVTIADQMFDQSHALELRDGNETVFVACRAHPPERVVTASDLEPLAGSMRRDSATRGIYVTTGT